MYPKRYIITEVRYIRSSFILRFKITRKLCLLSVSLYTDKNGYTFCISQNTHYTPRCPNATLLYAPTVLYSDVHSKFLITYSHLVVWPVPIHITSWPNNLLCLCAVNKSLTNSIPKRLQVNAPVKP
jgi:hypothetical protein